MRKLIIAGAAALVLFVVGAFAASFAVDSEDVASGADAVEACATDVDVDFTTDYSTAEHAYVITSVDLTFTGGSQCVGEVATVALEGTGDDGFAELVGTVASGGTLSLAPDGVVLAEDVDNAAVLVDDTEIPAP